MSELFTRPGATAPAQEELSHLREQVTRQAEVLALCRRIGATSGLEPLLALLGEELRRAGLFDGFLVTLPDAELQHLVCRHIDLPADFKSVEAAYRDFRIPLADANANSLAFRDNRPVFVDAAAAADQPELIRDRFQRWRIQELAVLPLTLEDGALGTVFGFVQAGRVDREGLAALGERLSLFAAPLRSAHQLHDLAQRERELETAAAERARFLDLVRHVTELTDVEQIYDLIAREILEWLPFDLCSVTVRQDDELRVKKHTTLRPELEDLARRLDAYCAAHPFRLEVSEGALASTFLNNRQVFFPDAMTLRHLPMSTKDREILDIMGTPRSILYMPIRRDDQPVGMLCLFTVGGILQPDDRELHLLASLCDVIGTAIGNAALYSTVERQRLEIEQALNELTRTQEQLRAAEAARLAALLQAKEAAEATAATKSAFVANTSHEIRTPLTAIIGFAESLVETALPESYPEQWAQIILRNSRHLLSLINNVLDVSRMEAGRIGLERLELSPLQLVADLEPTVAMLARGKDLEFRIDCSFPIPSRIVADPTRLRQVLLNLTNNAIKFTEHGQVRLELGYDPDGRRLRFAVIDTGIGIPAEALERIFQPFSQADASTTRRFGGTGLGLHIARNLVRLMGGELRVSSREGDGSRFEFDLPVGLEAPELDHALPEPVRGSPVERLALPRLGGTVLLADDSGDNRQLVSMFVHATGALITAVANGEEAVSEALTRPYDLVLLDVQMPVMSGAEAVRTLRELNYAGPVYALTANVGAQDLLEYRQAGFDGHLAKPIDRRSFFQLLREQLPAADVGAIHRKIDVSELEREFTRVLPEYIDRIQQGYDHQDWDRLASQAHRLKGTAGSLGRGDVTDAAAAVEALAKRRKADASAQGALEEALEGLRAAADTPPRADLGGGTGGA